MSLRPSPYAAVLWAALFTSACGPSLKSIRRYVENSPHQRIAILPFTPAPGHPNSGQEAADIFAENLQEIGFILVNRADLQKMLEEQKLSLSGALRAQDAIKLGQMLGVQAILTGTVGDSSEEDLRRPPVYENRYKVVRDAHGNPKQVSQRVLVMREEIVRVPVFAATVRLTDVQTGNLLWIGAGSDHEPDSTLQEVAAGVLKEMARNMGRAFLERKI